MNKPETLDATVAPFLFSALRLRLRAGLGRAEMALSSAYPGLIPQRARSPQSGKIGRLGTPTSAPRERPGLTYVAPAGAGVPRHPDLRGSRLHLERGARRAEQSFTRRAGRDTLR